MNAACVDGEHRLLAIADPIAGKEPRCPVAAQVRNDYPIARRREPGRDIGKAVDVIRPAMEQDHHWAAPRPEPEMNMVMPAIFIDDCLLSLFPWATLIVPINARS